MTATDADVQAACRAYAECAVAYLLDAGHELPPMHARGWGWQPYQEGSFVFRPMEYAERLLPRDAGGAHASAEFAACVDALRDHPVIGERLDGLVGSAFGASRLEAEAIPDRVLYRALADAETLAFDESRVEEAASVVLRWLTRMEERQTVLAPLSGLVADSVPIALESGLEIDAMTDDEAIDCLTVGLIRGAGIVGGGHAMVGPRFTLRLRETVPLRAGDYDDSHDLAFVQDAHERWRDVSEAVVFALRLLTAGTVSSPGLLMKSEHMQDARGGSFIPSSTPRHSMFESFRLDADDGPRLGQLWAELRDSRVRASKPLTTAVRRFGLAGERSRAQDQIIDLMIAAEAVFLPGESSESAHKLSLRAAVLLGDDTTDARHVATVMKRAYNARSKLAHGGEAPVLRLPDGSSATLEEYVALADDYMRRTLRLLVAQVAAGTPSPFDKGGWDRITFDRLS